MTTCLPPFCDMKKRTDGLRVGEALLVSVTERQTELVAQSTESVSSLPPLPVEGNITLTLSSICPLIVTVSCFKTMILLVPEQACLPSQSAKRHLIQKITRLH